MQIVIDIDYAVYGLLKYFEKGLGLIDKQDDTVETALMRAIIYGTPLPKGHGDLVDRGTYCSALEEKIKDWDVTSTEIHDKIHGISIAYNICNRLIPIIEADKE